MSETSNNNYVKGILFILLAAVGFGFMSFFVRLSGDLPSVEKSFFRNLVAAIFAAGVLIRNKVPLTIKKECRFPLFIRCAFGTTGILCNFYALDHLLLANANILFYLKRKDQTAADPLPDPGILRMSVHCKARTRKCICISSSDGRLWRSVCRSGLYDGS